MKLAEHEYATRAAEAFGCRVPGCRRMPIVEGSGFAMPFCKQHIEKLTRHAFEALRELAGASPFDTLAVGRAARAVISALKRIEVIERFEAKGRRR